MRLARRTFLGLAAAETATRLLAQDRPKTSAPSAHIARECSADTRRGDPWLEIHKANLAWNLRQIQARVEGKRVMAVVKANGYGHGLVGVARGLAAAGVEDFLVGKLEEACRLRDAGIRGRILNFGPYSDSDADEIIHRDITQNVYTDQVRELSYRAVRTGRRAHVQIKVDTGLGRFGVAHDRAVEFIESTARLPGIAIEGVFTTLTEDPEFDRVQLERLASLRGTAQRAGASTAQFHAASSDAILELPAAFREFDMVRPGIMLYGLYPSTQAEQERKIDLKQVMTLKCRVAFVRTLRAGESAGYHRAFTAAEPTRVATLAAGYSDGVPRQLAGRGHVLISGRRCPILAISANAVIARIGDAPAGVADEAVLIGTQGSETVLASEVAALTGSSVYAVVMEMSGLMPRLSA